MLTQSAVGYGGDPEAAMEAKKKLDEMAKAGLAWRVPSGTMCTVVKPGANYEVKLDDGRTAVLIGSCVHAVPESGTEDTDSQ